VASAELWCSPDLPILAPPASAMRVRFNDSVPDGLGADGVGALV
jgi:hypothetical protein